MLNPEAKLINDLSKPEMVPTRDGYGKAMAEVVGNDTRVVVLCADLTESTRSDGFKNKFPDRFIQVGVAEQNLALVASGMANYGKIPFIASYAAFNPGRNNEQIRTNIAINNVPVKIIGAHAGVSVGPDGATHQALEDVALMRVLPRMVVVVPCDAVEAHKATIAIAFNQQPSYVRLGREKSPVITTSATPFEIGQAIVMREGKDCTIIGCGILLHNALLAAEELSKEGIECAVINSHTIKPFDNKTLVDSVKITGAVVSIEEHQIAGGLGSVVAETLAKEHPTPQEFIGLQDRFGESGTAEELVEACGLGISHIQVAVKKVIARKK
ncbi:MAG: transketolase family protein [Candidatus Pacebacteria bacterium]|nr:transketolase family protein [Candidatus Paceibacterota bacterium]